MMLNFTQLSDTLRYQVELSVYSEDYVTNPRLFRIYLKRYDRVHDFVRSLRDLRKGRTTIESVALYWAIPVIMVKFFDIQWSEAI